MLQDWKSEKYQQLIGSGEVPPRPGVLRLMDEARAAGLLVAVCSAATKESVIFTLTSLLGAQRFSSLDCFMAGDDVPRKKPDPIIYQIAAGPRLRPCCSGWLHFHPKDCRDLRYHWQKDILSSAPLTCPSSLPAAPHDARSSCAMLTCAVCRKVLW